MEKINILIVEDNEDHLFFIKKTLSNNNYNLQIITNGTEAYNYLLNPKIKPEIVLLDNHLPGMNGLEILKKLESKKEDYGFILTTIDQDPDILVKALKEGALDLLIKTPDYLYTLPQKIEKVYEFYQSRKENIEKEKQYKTIIETTNDAVIIVNYKGKITEWNKASERLFNYSKKEAIGKTLSLIMPQKYIQSHNKSFKEAVKNGIKTKEKYIALEAVTKQGCVFPIELSISTWQSHNKPMFCAFIRDISQKKNIERDLLKSQEIAQLGSYNLDLLTQQATTSPIFDKITGFGSTGRKDFKNWRKIVHPDDVADNQKMLDNCIKTGAIWEREYRIIARDTKEVKWVYGKGEIIFKDNIAVGLVGTIQDITKSKLAEQKLRNTQRILEKSEIKYRNLFEKNKAVMLIIDPADGAILDANPTACNYYGWAKEELTNKKISDINILPREVIQKEMTLAKSAKKNYFNFEHRLANGQVHQVEVYSTPIKVSNKTLLHTIVHDITQRKLAEIALRKSEDKLGSLYENAPLSYQSLNSEGFLIDVNSVWLETLGYKRKDVINKHITNFLTAESIALFKKQFPKFKASGLLKNGIFKMIKKDGSTITISINGNVSRDDSGNFKQTYCNFIDITQLKKQELTKEIIYNITKKANEALPQKELFDFIRLELGKVIDTTNFYIALGNKESTHLSLPYMVDEKDNKSDFPKRNSLSGYVIDTQKSLLINNSDKKRRKILEHGPTSKCWLGTPLIINNNVIGVMAVQSYINENAYTQEDVALLELVASSISLVIIKSQDFEQIQLLSHAIKQSNEAVIITDIEGTIQFVNPAFTKLSGYTYKEAIGQNPRLVKSGEQPTEYYEALWNTILNGKTWSGEFVNKSKEGSQYLVNANISPIKNKKGQITHFVGIQEDITEKRKLERDYLHAFVDAQEVEKQSFGEELHDGVSQILSAQSMFIQVLKSTIDTKESKLIKLVEKISDLNVQAVNETRSIAHGLMSKQLKESGLIVAVEHICNDYSSSRDIDFSFRCKDVEEKEIIPQIKVNIFRIIQEVCTNTVRHSLAKKAQVKFAKTNKNQLKVIVKDNGIGIDFKKIKENNKGAGLKNIKRRIKLLNGTIAIKTAPNKGTQYIFIIPLETAVKK